MAYQITTIHPNGETATFTSAGEPFNTEWIKARLGGGWLETVPHFETYGNKRCVAFCDEERKLKGMGVNPRATYLWYACLVPEPFVPDTLNGPVVIITADTDEELNRL